MLRYIAKRVLSAIITIWFIMTLTFILMNAIPGDPFASEKMNDPVIIANMKNMVLINRLLNSMEHICETICMGILVFPL